MPDKLSTLSNTRSTKRVTLGDETSRWVDDNLHALSICDTSGTNKLMSLSWLTETESINDNHLVGREAVMKFADFDICWCNIGFLHSGLDCEFRHVETHKIDCGFGEKT